MRPKTTIRVPGETTMQKVDYMTRAIFAAAPKSGTDNSLSTTQPRKKPTVKYPHRAAVIDVTKAPTAIRLEVDQ